jgi:hypothetical protein
MVMFDRTLGVDKSQRNLKRGHAGASKLYIAVQTDAYVYILPHTALR